MALSKNAAEQVRLMVVAGTTADTDFHVTGIRTRDCVILSCYATDATEYDVDNFTISSAGHVQTTDNTSGKTLIILWADLSLG